MSASEDEYWLDKPESVNLLIKLLIGACVLTVLADFTYHKHAEFHFMELFAFDAVFGFAAYVGLVTTAKGLRKLIMRDEDYYGDVSANAAAGEERAGHGGGDTHDTHDAHDSNEVRDHDEGGAPHA